MKNGYIDLNIRPETIKLLDENIGRTLFDISHSNIFWLYLLGQRKQVKINKWDLIKPKSLCTAKREPSTEQKDNLQNKRKHLQMI